ncbi:MULTISPECIES: helix-turn-helix domain-containing protein [unclassified Pseudomonas]|uniref:helix-turn-helix domain-containing protein n=1 Tax=unclassified Pseudomonas TaxID=196821 RepID=UPI002AC90C87|nr:MULTISPECIES: helix-turn-helix domain-containing protein [unclassified Pseudomonas]MEB0040788.1 helix-turn-helix domain-containing protein [Pseudomonas sp. MH10]MEB0076286.1 helix-turn-helix domain-containing protein [Pseudomonas sp. MH10out]MEB0093702.1 helix-turn-helix domain-containing protein [Pseudomonas sp. CCI4.2]MEB0101075.1 helix-turn-helix domain-containing protein [Pseudomonas sp. CCI3.2]MEB0122957.1 helix-turn-helix domain-containing protein [Pseudomonas sp. CCI1.2]
MNSQTRGIGVRLRKERERLGLSQKAFGQRGGVATNAQSNYENGTRYPKSEYFVAVAETGIDILFVLTGKATPPCSYDLSQDEESVLISFRSLQRQDQEALSRLTTTIAGLLTASSKNESIARE